MKTFKRIDHGLQFSAVVLAPILYFSDATGLYMSYFFVGGIQLLSMVVHESAGFFTHAGTARRRYHNLAYILVACAVLAIWVPLFLPVFVVLLFTGPVMAVYYVWLCYRETYFYLKRPLSILK